MKKTKVTLLLLMAFMTAGVPAAFAQDDSRDYGRGWFVGVGGGTSFGQSTFRSVTENTTHWGAQYGVFGGYRVSRLFSIEALATMGRQSQTSLDCDPFWLSTGGERTYTPVIDGEGHYYSDLKAKTRWMRLGLQANFNVLSFLTQSSSNWSLTLSPQLSAVTTRTRHLAGGYDHEFSRQWHLGLGGQAAVGYRVARSIALQLYGGVTCLTGDRFDNIPKYHHRSNLIYEAGLKLSYRFGKKGRAASVIEKPAVIAESRPAAGEKPVEGQESVPFIGKAQPVAETVAVAEMKQETTEAAKVVLPVIYFANDSSRLTQDEAPKLDGVARMMKEQPDVTLSIYGHASDTGSEDYNLRLTQRRAETVKTQLVRLGVSADRLYPVVGKGIDSAASDYRQARRVELVINEK